MATPSPTAGPAHMSTGPFPRPGSKLPLHLLRHGSGLVAFGLLFGFLVPIVPYPRLGLTAHIQFCVEGTMVLAAGLVLQSDPFGASPDTKDEDDSQKPRVAKSKPLADRLTWLQEQIIYWGMVSIWPTLLSEAGNAWWGTSRLLKIAHEAAGLQGSPPAALWTESMVSLAHKPVILLATVWPTILYALFKHS